MSTEEAARRAPESRRQSKPGQSLGVSVPRAEPVPTVAPQNGRLTVDRLADPSELVEVITIDGLDVGCENEIAREPHRHDYHELIRMRSGTGVHAVDDSIVSVAPETVTLIGRGQVHVFAQAEGVSGAAVRFDAHYAEQLAVPAAALSQALTQASGRSTKELVTERVMDEAARLLRFSDRSVSEIAYLTGFGDPLYFSRAFKRQYGAAPSAFRDRARGLDA